MAQGGAVARVPKARRGSYTGGIEASILGERAYTWGCPPTVSRLPTPISPTPQGSTRPASHVPLVHSRPASRASPGTPWERGPSAIHAADDTRHLLLAGEHPPTTCCGSATPSQPLLTLGVLPFAKQLCATPSWTVCPTPSASRCRWLAQSPQPMLPSRTVPGIVQCSP